MHGFCPRPALFIFPLLTFLIASSSAAQVLVDQAVSLKSCYTASALPPNFTATAINNRSQIVGAMISPGNASMPAIVNAASSLAASTVAFSGLPPDASGTSGSVVAINDLGTYILRQSFFSFSSPDYYSDQYISINSAGNRQTLIVSHSASGPRVSALDKIGGFYGTTSIVPMVLGYPVERAAQFFPTVPSGFIPALLPVPLSSQASQSRVVATSGSGDVLVNSGTRAYVYVAPSSNLVLPADSASRPSVGYALSSNGGFAAGILDATSSTPTIQGALWTRQPSGFQLSIVPPIRGDNANHISNVIRAVNSSGESVGAWNNGALYFKPGMSNAADLGSLVCSQAQLAGFVLSYGSAINDRGEIIAVGHNANGQRTFLLRKNSAVIDTLQAVALADGP